MEIIGENRLIVRSKAHQARSVHPVHPQRCLDRFVHSAESLCPRLLARWRQGRFRPADESFRRTANSYSSAEESFEWTDVLFDSLRREGRSSVCARIHIEVGTMTTLRKDEKRGSKKSKKSGGEKTSGRSAKTAKQVPAKKSEPKVQAGIASNFANLLTRTKWRNDSL